LSRLTQIAPPHTRFVFLGAGFRLGLPSHPASRRRSCLRLGVSTTSSSRGLPPPSNRPCRAYSRRRRSAPPRPVAFGAGCGPAGPTRHNAAGFVLVLRAAQSDGRVACSGLACQPSWGCRSWPMSKDQASRPCGRNRVSDHWAPSRKIAVVRAMSLRCAIGRSWAADRHVMTQVTSGADSSTT